MHAVAGDDTHKGHLHNRNKGTLTLFLSQQETSSPTGLIYQAVGITSILYSFLVLTLHYLVQSTLCRSTGIFMRGMKKRPTTSEATLVLKLSEKYSCLHSRFEIENHSSSLNSGNCSLSHYCLRNVITQASAQTISVPVHQ